MFGQCLCFCASLSQDVLGRQSGADCRDIEEWECLGIAEWMDEWIQDPRIFSCSSPASFQFAPYSPRYLWGKQNKTKTLNMPLLVIWTYDKHPIRKYLPLLARMSPAYCTGFFLPSFLFLHYTPATLAFSPPWTYWEPFWPTLLLLELFILLSSSEQLPFLPVTDEYHFLQEVLSDYLGLDGIPLFVFVASHSSPLEHRWQLKLNNYECNN